MKLQLIDKKLLDLVEKAIKISEESLKEVGVFPPLLIIREFDGSESLHRFVEGKANDLVVKAREHIRNNAHHIECCVLSYNGHIALEAGEVKKNEAIIVIAYGKKEQVAYIFAEKYVKNGANVLFDDEISFIDQEKNALL